MFQIRRLWKNEKIRIPLLSLGLYFLTFFLKRPSGFLNFASDLLFTVGAVHLVVGGTRYISNVGLFKTFSYMTYKRRWRKIHEHGEARPMSLAEYTQNVIFDEMRQRPVGWPLLVGIGSWVVSTLLALLTL